jgi:methionine-rich copper-binding protein CopC
MVAGALLALPFGADAALAHAKLKHSSPAANARIPAGLKTIELEFSEALSADLSKFELDDAAGTAVMNTAGTGVCDKATCKLPAPTLEAGTYTLKYHVVSSDDGHVIDGKFSFTIKG